MPDFSYAFVTQFEEMKESIQELLWEETQQTSEECCEFFRMNGRLFENTEDGYELMCIVRMFQTMRGEHQPEGDV